MKTPDQDSIDSWLEISSNQIERTKQHIHGSFYKEHNIPIHGAYHTMGMDYASLGRARFLKGEPIDRVRETFSEAGQQVLHDFEMAYNINCFEYIGDKPKPDDQINAGYGQVDWSAVMETIAIDGLNWALMGKDFKTAERLAYWYQDTPDGYKMDAVVNRYIYAYKYTLLDKPDEAEPLLQATIDYYQAKPPSTTGDINYYTLSLILQGIVLKDAHQVNESLLLHLDFYKRSAIPSEDYWDTDQEFICDDAVALANLAIHLGIDVSAEHYLMPKGLLQYFNRHKILALGK